MAERIRGLSIGLDLESAGITRSLSEIRRSFNTLNSDLKLTSNNFKYTEKSTDSYKQRIRELDGTVKTYKKNVGELSKEYERVKEEQGENSKEAMNLRKEYNKQANELNRLEHELGNTTEEFKRFQKEANDAARISNSAFGKLGQQFTDLGPKFKEVGDQMKNVGRSMSMYVTAPVVAGFGLAAKKGIDFDDAMRKVQATSGASGKDLEKLKDKAREMGATTKFSASDAADGLNYMALAGWKTNDMMEGLPGIMNLAAASGEDLGAVSDIVTDGLTAFGLKAKDSAHFADVLAQTSSNANTDVSGLGEAFKYAAPVAGALGYSIEDTSIAIGLMSNAGIKGEKSGTALRTMFTNLAKPTKAMANQMEDLGLSITDSNGKMLPMRDIMDKMRSSFKNLSKDQQASAAATIFGKEAMSGALAIINASDEDYQKLTKSIDGSSGAAKRMSDTMEGGVGGKLRTLRSQIEELALTLYDYLQPAISKTLDIFSGIVTAITNIPKPLQIMAVGFAAIAAALGPALLVAGMFTSSIGSMMTVFGPLITGVVKAGGVFAFLSTKMAPILTKFPILQSVFTGLTGPIGIAIAVIGGLTAAFVIAYKKSETFRNIVNGVVNSVKKVFTDFGNVIKGFKGLFTDEGYDGGIALLKSVGLSDSTIQKMDDFALKFNEFKAKIMAVVNMFKGDWMKGRSLLQWTGMDQQQIINVENAVIKVKLFFHNLKEDIINVFSAIKTFAISIGAQISTFWNKNGTEIMQALTNISNAFRTIFMAIYTVVSTVFNTLILPVIRVGMTIMQSVIRVGMNVIQSVMSVVWMVVKALVVSTWNNIKGVIQGALNIIMGVIKVFSSLFTGNWKGLWSGIKQILKGSVQLIWNLINLWFVGKILGTVRVFGGLFKGLFSGIWNAVKKIFSTALSAVFNSSKRSFTNIFNIGKSIFNALRGFFSYIWNVIKNVFSSTLGNIWGGVKNSFSKIFEFGKNTFTRLKNTMSNLWNTIKENTVGKAEAMKKKVTGIFGGMKDGIKKHIDKIKDHIGGMTKGVKKGLNKLIGGVNWVGAKLGMDKIPEVKLHTGTGSLTKNGKLTRDTFATVGDKGRGNGPGGFRHEMIRYPNGKTVLTPDRDTKAFLPKGSQVINGQDTYNYLNSPRFANGTDKKPFYNQLGDAVGKTWNSGVDATKDFAGKTIKGAKEIGKKALESIGDVYDFATNPGKLVDKVLKAFGVDFSFVKGDILGGLMKGMYKKLKGSVKALFARWLDDGGGGGDGSSFTKFTKTTPYSPNGAVPGYPSSFNGGKHFGIDYATPVGTVLKAPTTGTVARQHNHGGGLVAKLLSGKFTQFFLHLSEVLKTGPVKKGEAFAKTGNSGAWTTGPHLHYQVEKGASPSITNANTIDPEKFLSGVGGGKDTVGKNWSSEIRRAARQMKVSITEADVRAINAQIMRESSGNQNIVQSSSVWDVNTASGNPAQGLLQYIPQTFKAYAVRGHNNIRSGYDQLLAFFNNSNWRRDNPGGRSGWGPTGSRRFATGGLIKNAGWYNIAEGGYPEWVIPTDPKRSSEAMAMLAMAANQIRGNKTAGNKRPSQLSNSSIGSSNNDALLFQMIQQQQEQIALLAQIVQSNQQIADKDFTIDKYEHKKQVFEGIDDYNRQKSRKSQFRPSFA